MEMKRFIAFLFVVVTVLSSCTEYSKALKETDPVKKLASAKSYYEQGECFKALPMLEELIGLTRGTQKSEEVYYYFAKTHYCLKDYYMGNYYFKSYAKSFSSSPKAEECLFMAALCSYNLSPSFTLDQTDSKTAIDELQYFLDQYPASALRDSANHMISDLNFKIEKKDFEVAELYVQTMKYKAASSSLQEFLKKYPQSKFREQAMLLIIESKFLLAEGSIDTKKLERYRETMESYITFVSAFPKSKSLDSAEEYYLKSEKMVAKLTIK
jgi:outer membrane protein assembly factor BamD